MGAKQEVLLEGDLDIEKGFNDAIEDLRKSLGQDTESGEAGQVDLEKAGKAPPQFDKDKNEDAEPEKEGEEDEDKDKDEDEDNSYHKSIEDSLREEPQAAAAMDVEPFLLQLAKALDEGMIQLQKAVIAKFGKVETLVKSMGSAALASATLQKSTREVIMKIGGQPIPTGSMMNLRKARFDGAEKEVDTREVLTKSREWVKTGKIDILEAGNIEGRINKGLLGKVNDPLDHKVAELMKQEAN